MDHVALSPHGARRGGFRCAGLALRKPVSARAGPEGCSAGGDAGRRGVAGGLVEALFRWTTYGPSGLAASRHARRRPIEPFSPGVVVRGSGWRGREPSEVVGRIGPVLVEMCILSSRCAFCSREVQLKVPARVQSARFGARGGGAGRPGGRGDRRGRRPRRGPRRRRLSKSVAKAPIAPKRRRRIVDIPRFLSPPIPARDAFATDLDTPPPRTAPGAPPAPQPCPPTRTITPIPPSPEGFLVRKAQ